MEQGVLFDKFKLDEPWDSPHNKELLKYMPLVYQCPSRANAQPYTTTYRGFVGHGAMFETGRDIRIADITDGTSNTIAVVEAKEAVAWTKPDDLPFAGQADRSLYGAGSSHPGRIQLRHGRRVGPLHQDFDQPHDPAHLDHQGRRRGHRAR